MNFEKARKRDIFGLKNEKRHLVALIHDRSENIYTAYNWIPRKFMYNTAKDATRTIGSSGWHQGRMNCRSNNEDHSLANTRDRV